MTALVWDQRQSKRYEAGVSRGVFYPLEGPGVVWNGLLSVAEDFVGASTNDYYLDGVKYITLVGGGDTQAVIRAFSAPEEFSYCIGEREVIPGFVLTQQPKDRFHFTYQTSVNDGESYKIHLVYNALATPISRSVSTIGESIDPSILEWRIQPTPVLVQGHKPTSYLVVDSSEIDLEILEVLTDLLYGTDTVDPIFPSIDTLLMLFDS